MSLKYEPCSEPLHISDWWVVTDARSVGGSSKVPEQRKEANGVLTNLFNLPGANALSLSHTHTFPLSLSLALSRPLSHTQHTFPLSRSVALSLFTHTHHTFPLSRSLALFSHTHTHTHTHARTHTRTHTHTHAHTHNTLSLSRSLALSGVLTTSSTSPVRMHSLSCFFSLSHPRSLSLLLVCLVCD